MLCIRPLIKINAEHLQEKFKCSFMSYKWFSQQADINTNLKKRYIEIFPCNRCHPCVGMKRYQWVQKMKLEGQAWKYKYFITLTYSPDHIPLHDHLNKKDPQNFMKLLRYYLKQTNNTCKYFTCGEYGTKTSRPHYHTILFTDYQLPLKFIKNTKNGPLYESPIINKAWKHKGHIWIAHILDEKPLSYVASYSNKKHIKQQYNINFINLENLTKKLNYETKFHNLNGWLIYELIHNEYMKLKLKPPEFFLASKAIPMGANAKSLKSPKSLLKWLHKQELNKWQLLNPNTDIQEYPYHQDQYYQQLQKNKINWDIYTTTTNISDLITNNQFELQIQETKKDIAKSKI